MHHDVAEVAGIPAYSFGEEGVDRAVLLCKKEFTPGEDEIAALRRGETWDPEKAKEIAHMRELERKEEEEESQRKPKRFVPNSNYREKYEHLIGRESAKEAARVTQTNKQYGFVPSENKKDVRSIEQTLADIQSKKRLKLYSIQPYSFFVISITSHVAMRNFTSSSRASSFHQMAKIKCFVASLTPK
uniref:Sperm-associated antigen 7 n=1 Tax=Timema cristinae TaxID=61476 RepID=A0A7R9CLY7_TIMCR|nr:unnamed protein product [Timema cristinae]